MGWSWRRVVLMGAVGIAAISIGYRVSQAPEETKAAALPLPLANRGMPDSEAEIRALQDRVGANPNDAEGWQRLGWAYFESGRHADAVRAYRHAAKLAPGNATVWSPLGEAAVMASEHEIGRASCRERVCQYG